ncbi:MBL fold metallo-hydrolase [Brucellaceae bacterium C25G]
MSYDPRPSLKLLRVGHCLAPKALTAKGASWRITSFPAGVALIDHPDAGSILFDTGYGSAFMEATNSFPERIYRWLTPVRLADHEVLPRQLTRLGISQPDLVFFSHLHADHAAGFFDLEDAPERLITSTKAIDGLKEGRIRSLRSGCPRGLRDRLRKLSFKTIEQHKSVDLAVFGLAAFGVGFDLLNDGSVIAVSLPGHGHGQFGLYLPKLVDGAAFLIADAAWSLAALRNNTPPPFATLHGLGDAKAYLKTFKALRDLHLSQPDLRLIASHCSESFSGGAHI